MVMNTRKALNKLAGIQQDDFVSDGGPLAASKDKLLARYEQMQQKTAESQQRHEVASRLPMLESAMQKLQAMVGEQATEDIPLTTRFDAFEVVKNASRDYPKDNGLRRMATHLDHLWHQEPLGVLSANTVSRLRDHYQAENPRSILSEVINSELPKVAFNNLNVSELTRIASTINSQEDYDFAIERYGLGQDNLNAIRARTFIRAMVDRKSKLAGYAGNEVLVDHEQMRGAAEAPAKAQTSNLPLPTVQSPTPAPTMKNPMAARGDIATRVANRIGKIAQQMEAPQEESTNTAESEITAEEKDKKVEETMGVDGTGMLPIAARHMEPNLSVYDKMAEVFAVEQKELNTWLTSNKVEVKVGSAPPGWGDTVKDMKKDAGIENPITLAWFMLDKGYEPGAKRGTLVRTAGSSQKEFHPKVNEQQPPRLTNVKKDQGGSVLTEEKDLNQRTKSKVAIGKDNPLVEDGKDHLPIDTWVNIAKSYDFVKRSSKLPAWWLGSRKELIKTVKAAIKALRDQPVVVVQTAQTQTQEKVAAVQPKKVEELTRFENLNAQVIENELLSGYKVAHLGYSLNLDESNMLVLTSKTGSKNYAMIDIEGAISDYLYLVKSSKLAHSPSPVFDISDALSITCPDCNTLNRYEMPKTASALACGNCQSVIASNEVSIALDSGVANEEVALLCITPIPLQEVFGEHIARAAEKLGATEIDIDGCKALAFAKVSSNDTVADVWDDLVKAGFKPLAQLYGGGVVAKDEEEPPMPEGDELGDDTGPMDPSAPGMEAPMGMGDEMGPNLGMGMDPAMLATLQAAMKYYHETGLNAVKAITQYERDFGEKVFGEQGENDHFAEQVLQVAAAEYSMPLDQLRVAAKKADISLPGTVNQQQPNAVTPQNLGPDSETQDLLPTPGAIKTEHPMSSQPGTSSTSLELGEDSDNRDMGRFQAPKPMAQPDQHNQSGESLSNTNLGPDSETQMGTMMNQMDSQSGQAYNNVRSK